MTQTYGTTASCVLTTSPLHFSLSESPNTPLGVYNRLDGNSKKGRFCLGGNGVNDSLLLKIISLLFIFSASVTIILIVHIYTKNPNNPFAIGKTVSDHPRCSQLGNQILRERGGNAVDAVIGTTLCMSLLAPHLLGIGGGGIFLIHQSRKNQTVILDFLESAPSELSNSSIGVPGFLKGLEYAHNHYGSSILWKEIVEMAMDVGKFGLNMTEHLFNATITKVKKSKNNAFSHFFFSNNHQVNAPYIPKDIYDKWMSVYESIAINGSDALYNGPLGQLLTSEIPSLTMEDLANYSVVEREALGRPLTEKYSIFTSGPPTSGPKLLSILKALSIFSEPPNLQTLYQIYNEFEEKNNKLGDPSQLDVESNLNMMLDSNEPFLEKKYTFLSSHQITDVKESENKVKDRASSSISAMDNNDDYVVGVCSYNSFFGSQIMTSNGILLNDALSNFDEFSILNKFQKGQRPLSQSALAFIQETQNSCGKRLLIGGSSASSVAHVLSQSLLFNQDLNKSVSDVRMEVRNHMAEIEDAYSSNFDAKILAEFKKSHSVYFEKLPFSSVNVLEKFMDRLMSVSDFRSGNRILN